MPSVGMQMLASALCLLGWFGVVFSCLLPMWRVTAFVGTSIMTSQIMWEGIWMDCVVESTGHVQCKPYDSMLALTSDIQAARALMVLAVATGGIGLILAFVGGKCTRFLDEEEDGAKGKVAVAAGAVLIATGLLCLIPTLWAAAAVVNTFYSTTTDAQRRELGACLYIGWGAALLLVLGGGLFIQSACPIKAHNTDKSPSGRYLVARSASGSTHGGSYYSRVPTAMAQPMRVLSPRPQSFKGVPVQPQFYSRPLWDNRLEQNSREDSERSWAPSKRSQMMRQESVISKHSEALSTKSQLRRSESAMSKLSEAPSTKSQLKQAEMEETLAASKEKYDTPLNPTKTFM